jgi:hypothetical protein
MAQNFRHTEPNEIRRAHLVRTHTSVQVGVKKALSDRERQHEFCNPSSDPCRLAASERREDTQ